MKNKEVILLAIIGWSLIISIWIWQAYRYYTQDDFIGTILHILVAFIWTIFAVVTTRKNLKKRKQPNNGESI